MALIVFMVAAFFVNPALKSLLNESDYDSLAEKGIVVVKIVGGTLGFCIVALNLLCLGNQIYGSCRRKTRRLEV